MSVAHAWEPAKVEDQKRRDYTTCARLAQPAICHPDAPAHLRQALKNLAKERRPLKRAACGAPSGRDGGEAHPTGLLKPLMAELPKSVYLLDVHGKLGYDGEQRWADRTCTLGNVLFCVGYMFRWGTL